MNTYLIPTGNSNAYAYIAYNAVSTAGVTSAVEELVAAYPSMVDLGTLAAWQGGGAAPPSPGANDITQMSTASNQDANTSITMRDDGGFQNGLWPAQTFTTKAASQVISNIVTNIVVGVSTNYVTNFASASGWQATTLSVKTAGGGNFVLDCGWGTGFAIAGNLYDVAFYSLSGTGNTNATLIAGPYKYYGKGTENNWMQFQALQVDRRLTRPMPGSGTWTLGTKTCRRARPLTFTKIFGLLVAVPLSMEEARQAPVKSPSSNRQMLRVGFQAR